MIIDAHVHISYLPGERKFPGVKNVLLSSMKENKIDYSVVIPDNVPNTQCADMKTLKLILENEKKLFSMGTVNIFQELDKQIRNLRKLSKNRELCAIKLFPGHDPFYPTDKRCHPVYTLCIENNIPVVFHTGISVSDESCAKYNDPKYLVEIAEKYKNLKIVISHFFWPKMEYCYEITKNFDNINYDTSAIADPEVVNASGGWNNVSKILKAVALEKPDNLIFGSDWPMCPVEKHIELIKGLGLSAEAEEKIFSKNAIKLYLLQI